MDEFQTYINPVFQPFGAEDDSYDNSDSSATSPRDFHFSQSETESSNRVVMPVMVIEAINLEEQLADMTAKLDELSKESAENDAQIKCQGEWIAKLVKKLERKSFEVSNKGSGAEDSDKESNHSEESDDERKAKKDRSLGSMSVEHIQNLIANMVKAHLEGGSHKTHCYSKPYTKRIDALRMPQRFQPPKFHQFDDKGDPK